MDSSGGTAWYNCLGETVRFTLLEDLAMSTFVRRPTGLRLAAATTLLLMTVSTRAQRQYQVTDLGTLGGPTLNPRP